MFPPKLALALAWLCFALAVCGQTPTLKTCAEVRSLPRAVAEQRVPVEIRGVVTLCFPGKFREMVVQDGSAAIYIDRTASFDSGLVSPDVNWPESLRRGDLVEIKGFTSSGHFAPIITPTEIRYLGGGPLPEGISVSPVELLNGKWDCQFVRLEGVVQSAEDLHAKPEKARLIVASPNGRIPVYSLEPIENADTLVDTEIAVSGVVFTYFNSRGECVGARLGILNRTDITVTKAAPTDPFAVPETPLAALRSFSPEGDNLHRVRCSGIVTLVSPGLFFYIQDGRRGVRVESRSTLPLEPGNAVEVSGFVEMADHFGKICEATVRKVGHGERPAPASLERKRVLGTSRPGILTNADDVDGLFARLTGKLVKIDLSQAREPRLLVESEGHVVPVIVTRSGNGTLPAELHPGCDLEADGVFRVELSSQWPAQEYPFPANFHVLADSARDIRITRAAPWWTPARLWILSSAICLALVGTLAWNRLLRRKVEIRSAELARAIQARREAAVKFDATLAERERLAADLHDNLEQLLTSLALQLEAGSALREKAPNRSATHLHIATQLAARSREEVRRSVWNLRTQSLDGHSLLEALKETAGLLRGGLAPAIEVRAEGIFDPISDVIAANLLLLAREAITNALKHANASRIDIVVHSTPELVQVSIEDDGSGFDEAGSPGPQQGHFGLLGMRERVKRLGGSVTIRSEARKGTCITAAVPLAQRLNPNDAPLLSAKDF
jgi:signal transduction histidine kinase